MFGLFSRRTGRGPGEIPPTRMTSLLSHVDLDRHFESLPGIVMSCDGQLSQDDRLLYWWAAKEYYSGAGTIVDGGALVGGTTTILAEGLLANTNCSPADESIIVYDLFVDDKDGYSAKLLKGWYKDDANQDPIYDFEPHFRRNTKKYERLLSVQKGDITRIGYHNPRDIEILSIDVAKTPAIMHYVARKFFPRLVFERSLVLHQDYIFCFQPWLIIAMGMMADLVEKVYDVAIQCTSAFVPLRPITEADVIDRLGSSSDGYYAIENAKYIYAAIDQASTPLSRLFMTGALIYFYFVKGRLQTARHLAARMINEFNLSVASIERYTQVKQLFQTELALDYASICG